MTAIVRRFKNYGGLNPGNTYGAETRANAYGSETRANSLREEYDEMESDAERVVGQTLQIIERERQREDGR